MKIFPTTDAKEISLIAIALVIIMLASGCASPRQNFYAGQGFDYGTTHYALEINGGFEETNPLANNMQDVLLMKLVAVGVFEGLAHLFPKDADRIYWIGAVTGYGAGAWNIYQVAK